VGGGESSRPSPFHTIRTMANLKLLKTDTAKESEGVWVDWELDVKLRIARMGNPAFDAMMKRLSQPHLKKVRDRSIEGDEALEAVIVEAAAHTLLVGWKNIEDENGKAIKYSAKKAYEFFKDDGLRDLYKFVLSQANDAAQYRQSLDEDAAGN